MMIDGAGHGRKYKSTFLPELKIKNNMNISLLTKAKNYRAMLDLPGR